MGIQDFTSELWVSTFGRFVVVDCRRIASASPVAVQPRSRWLLSVWPQLAPTVVARWRPSAASAFSAPATREMRSDRCLARRLGGNKRQRVGMHDCASYANLICYNQCIVYCFVYIASVDVVESQKYNMIF